MFQDTALSVGIFNVDGKSDISFLTPGSSPGVLNNPVWLISSGVESNSEDTVVELVTAVVASDDSTTVVLEYKVVGFDGNTDWLSRDGLEQSILVANRNVFVVRDSDNVVVLLRLVAGSPNRELVVWVVLLGVDTSVVDDVLEGVVHNTSVAAFVDLVTVDQLLLGQARQVSSLDEVDTFHGSGTGESPAGTAHSLVLNTGDSPLLAPVNLINGDDVGVRELGRRSLLADVLHLWVQVESSELLWGQVSQGSEVEPEGKSLLVVFTDKVQVLGENGESLGNLLDVVHVLWLVLLKPSCEVMEVASFVESFNVLWVSLHRHTARSQDCKESKDSNLVHVPRLNSFSKRDEI